MKHIVEDRRIWIQLTQHAEVQSRTEHKQIKLWRKKHSCADADIIMVVVAVGFIVLQHEILLYDLQ